LKLNNTNPIQTVFDIALQFEYRGISTDDLLSSAHP